MGEHPDAGIRAVARVRGVREQDSRLGLRRPRPTSGKPYVDWRSSRPASPRPLRPPPPTATSPASSSPAHPHRRWPPKRPAPVTRWRVPGRSPLKPTATGNATRPGSRPWSSSWSVGPRSGAPSALAGSSSRSTTWSAPDGSASGTEVARHDRQRRDRTDPADPVAARDAPQRPGRHRRGTVRRRSHQRHREGGRGGRRRHRRRGRRRGPQVPRCPLRVGRERPGAGCGLLGAGAAGLPEVRHRAAAGLRRPGPCRPAGGEPGAGPARRPDRLGQLQPQQRRRPHRDLHRRRPDDRGPPSRRRRAGRPGHHAARRHPPGAARGRSVVGGVGAVGSASGRIPAGTPYADLFSRAGQTYGVDPALLAAVARRSRASTRTRSARPARRA